MQFFSVANSFIRIKAFSHLTNLSSLCLSLPEKNAYRVLFSLNHRRGVKVQICEVDTTVENTKIELPEFRHALEEAVTRQEPRIRRDASSYSTSKMMIQAQKLTLRRFLTVLRMYSVLTKSLGILLNPCTSTWPACSQDKSSTTRSRFRDTVKRRSDLLGTK